LLEGDANVGWTLINEIEEEIGDRRPFERYLAHAIL
jgi:hypothetical protein